MPTDPEFHNPYQLPPAQLLWDDSGAPVSADFDDIYFSRGNGSA
jgi:tRNA U34 5-methylaminomethyl-2-thiouridine-forming methyltransferase MnmC